jgi:hypothetical protein
MRELHSFHSIGKVAKTLGQEPSLLDRQERRQRGNLASSHQVIVVGGSERQIRSTTLAAV